MNDVPFKFVTPIPIEQQAKISLAFKASEIRLSSDSITNVAVKIRNDSDSNIGSSQKSNVYLSYKFKQNSRVIEGVRTKIETTISAQSSVELSLIIDTHEFSEVGTITPYFVQEKIAWLDHVVSNSIPLTLKPAVINEGARYARNRPVHSNRTPFIFNFELTNKCPFSCIMCARTNNMTREEGIMSFDLFREIIDQLDHIGSDKTQEMWLHGFGESLVHPDFDQFLSYAVDKGFNVGLSVNPFLLTNKTSKKLLNCRPRHLYLAIDGHDNESFEKIRGLKGAYDKSVERLENFLSLKNALSPNTKIDIGMIDFELNKTSIAAMKEKWNNIDQSVNFFAKPFTTWDGSAEDVLALKNSTRTKIDSLNKPVTCDFPWKKMTVNWDGKVTPCCFDYNKKYVLGDLSQQSINDIWNGDQMKKLRAEFKSGNVTNPLCENCEMLK
ncbi:hypothetical protein BM527_16430 [Alteromonas sp. Mex14]|nr:hypothetical protein BM527_16430 [Alteromonas sp. Mex14]